MGLKRSFLCCCFMALFTAATCFAQSSSGFEAKYGVALKVYQLRPGVVMTANFAQDGQVCAMYIERRHNSESGIDMRIELEPELVTELIDELVPESERGGKGKNYGLERITGAISESLYDYENVSIVLFGSADNDKCNGVSAIRIKWKNRSCK